MNILRRNPAPIERQTDTIREEDIETALELIRKSQKPSFFAGGGAVLSAHPRS